MSWIKTGLNLEQLSSGHLVYDRNTTGSLDLGDTYAAAGSVGPKMANMAKPVTNNLLMNFMLDTISSELRCLYHTCLNTTTGAFDTVF